MSLTLQNAGACRGASGGMLCAHQAPRPVPAGRGRGATLRWHTALCGRRTASSDPGGRVARIAQITRDHWHFVALGPFTKRIVKRAPKWYSSFYLCKALLLCKYTNFTKMSQFSEGNIRFRGGSHCIHGTPCRQRSRVSTLNTLHLSDPVPRRGHSSRD